MNQISILKIVKKIFGEKAELADNPKEVEPKNRYLVIPGKSGNPRWILPTDSNIGLCGLQFWWPYDFLSKLKWQIILKAYRLNKLTYLPGAYEIGIIQTHPIDWSHLGFREDAQPVIYVGDPYARCKAVVFLVNSNNKACQYLAKVPLGKTANKKTTHEALILKSLEISRPGISPRCLFENVTQGIIGQEVLKVTNTTRQLTKEHTKWLINLRQENTQISLASQGEDLWNRLQSIPVAQEYKSQIEPLRKHLKDETQLCAVWSHGDFAPWNFKMLQNENCYVAIDWEEGRRNMLPLYDLIHYCYSQSAWRHGENIAKTILENPWSQLYINSFNIPSNLVGPIVLFFLIDYWCRRLEEEDFNQAKVLFHQIKPFLEI